MISGRHDLLLGLPLYFGLYGQVSFPPASGFLQEKERYAVDAVVVLTNVLMRATESDRTRTPAGKTIVSETDSFQGITSAILVLTWV